MNKVIPISIITGYLGSGKTTLINHILANAKGYKIAVIVNDIGEVNIDAELIAKGGIVSSKGEDLVSLSNGCICCTLRKDLIEQVMGLVNSGKFDHIMIEASGICEPIPIAQSIYYIESACQQQFGYTPCKLDAVISVVDALRMSDEFEDGSSLLNKANEEDDISNIVINQIEFCDVLILNKSSLIAEEKLDKVRKIVKALQPNAKLIETDFSNVDLDEILDTNLFDFEKAVSSAGWIAEFEKDKQEVEEKEHKNHHHHDGDEHDCHCYEHEEGECHCHEHGDGECHCHDDDHHNGEESHCNEHHHHGEGCTCNACRGEADEFKITTFVYYRRKPFNKDKFDAFTQKDFGRKIIRTKGMVYFDDDLDTMYIYEQAGKQKVLQDNGPFVASMSKQDIKQAMQDSSFAEIWDDEYGDRMIKLVFIGQNLNKKEVTDILDNI